MSDLLDADASGRVRSGGGVGHAVVSAGCPEAAQTGASVLSSGGNAVDAAIAASAVQCARELPWCGLGGDGFALVSGADGALESLNGAGAVPRALATVEIPGGTLPRFGPLSVSTPGLVDAWWRLWERYGTRPFSELLEPAAELADRGFELDEAFAHALSKPALASGTKTRSMRSSVTATASQRASTSVCRRWPAPCARSDRTDPRSSIRVPSARLSSTRSWRAVDSSRRQTSRTTPSSSGRPSLSATAQHRSR